MIHKSLRRAINGQLVALAVASTGLHAQSAVVIRNVNVVDVEQGAVLPRRTVVVRAGRIVNVAVEPVAIPRDATVVDGSGDYVIPGLWDMHVHYLYNSVDPAKPADSAAAELQLRYMRALSIANGVLGVRDMAGDLVFTKAANARAETRGDFVPRMLLTGYKLGTRPVVQGAPFPINSSDDIRRSVEMLKAAGATHLKFAKLPDSLLRVTMTECRRLGLPCVGHIAGSVPPGELSALGLRSGEHLFLLPEYTATDGNRLVAEEDRPTTPFLLRVAYRLGLKTLPRDPVDVALATHDTAQATRLFRDLAAHGTWMTPTLVLSQAILHIDPADEIMQQDDYLITPREGNIREERRSTDALARARRTSELHFRIVKEMHDAGVPILAGTDAPTNVVPAFGLHKELALLVRAGLSPAEALRASTLDPARYMGGQDSLGTIARGRVADLVLLRANPLADIHATLNIEAVVTRGRLLRRRQLDSLLNVAQSTRDALRLQTDGDPVSAAPRSSRASSSGQPLRKGP